MTPVMDSTAPAEAPPAGNPPTTPEGLGALASAGPCGVQTQLLQLPDTHRTRQIPLKAYLPAGDLIPHAPRGLILFTHGLGGNREGGSDWLQHWASWGFAGIALQHPGSDEAVLGGSPLALRRALKTAMTPEQLGERLGDVRALLDALLHPQHLGHARFPPLLLAAARQAIGIAGHSFGAVTVQRLAGEKIGHLILPVGLPGDFREPRLKAFIGLSPSARGESTVLTSRFAGIRMPFFSITGSRDDGMGLMDLKASEREIPYRHMPGPDKYLLVLEGGAHPDFSGQPSKTEQQFFRPRIPAAHLLARIKAGSTAFWLAHLADDSAARHWLCHDFAHTLHPDDRFEHQ